MANPIIDRARLHFSASELRHVEVPEWGDEGAPLVVYFSPLTLAEKQLIVNRSQAEGSVAAQAHVLVLKARHADGRPMFDLEDKRALLTQCDPMVVERVASAIVSNAGEKEAEKN